MRPVAKSMSWVGSPSGCQRELSPLRPHIFPLQAFDPLGQVAERVTVIAGVLDRAAGAGLDGEEPSGVGVVAVAVGETVAQGLLGQVALGVIGIGGAMGVSNSAVYVHSDALIPSHSYPRPSAQSTNRALSPNGYGKLHANFCSDNVQRFLIDVNIRHPTGGVRSGFFKSHSPECAEINTDCLVIVGQNIRHVRHVFCHVVACNIYRLDL